MKTTATLFIILFSSITSSLFSQAFSTKEYLKATNNLWNVCSNFRTVKNSDDFEKERNSILPLLKSNIESMKI